MAGPSEEMFDSGFPPSGEHPEDAAASSTLFSRAFIPPCILG
jgi:hypothetical protein